MFGKDGVEKHWTRVEGGIGPGRLGGETPLEHCALGEKRVGVE